MADQIEVRGIRALGIIGVCREEQERPQPFEIDFDVDTDVATAGPRARPGRRLPAGRGRDGRRSVRSYAPKTSLNAST